MEQQVIIECWSCRLVYPGAAKCGICGGRGMIRRLARMADGSVGHDILAQALDAAKDGPPARRREALIGALICWQIYGVGYVGVERRVLPGSDEFKRAHAELRDRLVGEIRRLDRGL